MPGIFGGSGCSPRPLRVLRSHYHEAWGKGACEATAGERWLLGGHAFGSATATGSFGGLEVVVDGDAEAYEALGPRPGQGHEPPLGVSDGFLDLHAEFRGNAAALCSETDALLLARDWAGSLPVYYARCEDGLLFADHLRPLARATEAEVDDLGVLQYVRQGYIYGDRTPFRSIHRLRPGEVLRFDPQAGSLETRDRSRLWVGGPIGEGERPARLCLDHLLRVLRTTFRSTARPALMMSGGWDSRTLLAASAEIGADEPSLLGFSHGDVDSRELSLVRRLCAASGVPYHGEPIDDRVFELSRLHEDFARTGLAVFPHWQRAARVLSALGRDAAMAGIFGEVIGGHYGRTMATHGLRKPIALLRESRGMPGSAPDESPVDAALRTLRLDDVHSSGHWYLHADFARSIADKKERINAELRSALVRFRKRGVPAASRLIEACISEHRGSQYIAGQTRSCRTAVDVALPFADRRLLHVASRIPPDLKVHNSLNRKMLSLLDSRLLGYPLAATLVPASAPFLVQEASRAVRKLWEEARWRGYSLTGGKLPPPRLSWVFFEFMRGSAALERLLDDLEADIWDRSALRRRFEQIRTAGEGPNLHHLFDQLGKIYTVDRLLA